MVPVAVPPVDALNIEDNGSLPEAGVALKTTDNVGTVVKLSTDPKPLPPPLLAMAQK